MKDLHEKRFRKAVAIAFLFAIAFGALSVQLGQDANWDLKNYHVYNPYQLLHGRLWVDLNAAGMQSLFNPLPDLPYYFLSSALADYPRIVAFVMGLNNALLALGTTWITFLLFARQREEISFIAIAAAIYIGISGGISISELGTTFNDLPSAYLVLFGIGAALLAGAGAHEQGVSRSCLFIASGALFGAAAGLKVASAMFAPAFVLALLLTNGPRVGSLVPGFLFCVGWAAGLAVSGGWWLVAVYALTGNPVFPAFNQIFRSDWYPPVAFFDERWRTRGLLQTIAFPFFWIRRSHSVVTEVWYGDARFAVGYVAFLVLGANAIAQYVRRSTLASARSLPREARFTIWFIVLSYGIWQITFCIARYAIAIEALLGILILLAVWVIASTVSRGSIRRRIIDLAMVIIALLLQVVTHYPDWGRVPFGNRTFAIEAPSLPPKSLVVVSGSPNAYVIPYLRGEDVGFIGVTSTTVEARNYRLWNETANRIKSHEGPILVLERTDGTAMTSVLNEMGLSVDSNQCTSIPTNLDKDIRLCRAHPGRAQ
jgi:hypothetical protein